MLARPRPVPLSTDQARWPRLRDADRPARCIFDAITYLPDDILVKVDRASMAASLEARAPLLDHRVVEFAWRLPLAQQAASRARQVAAAAGAGAARPADLIERPKRGFGVPLGDWLRGPLRDWAEDLLDPTRSVPTACWSPC